MKMFGIYQNNNLVAIFKEIGKAIQYCHLNGLQKESISEIEISIRTFMGR